MEKWIEVIPFPIHSKSPQKKRKTIMKTRRIKIMKLLRVKPKVLFLGTCVYRGESEDSNLHSHHASKRMKINKSTSRRRPSAPPKLRERGKRETETEREGEWEGGTLAWVLGAVVDL